MTKQDFKNKMTEHCCYCKIKQSLIKYFASITRFGDLGSDQSDHLHTPAANSIKGLWKNEREGGREREREVGEERERMTCCFRL